MAEEVKPDATGNCPFCGRAVSVRWGDPPKDQGHLFHAMPMCRQFETMTADEFVRAVVTGRSAERYF